MHSVLHVLKRLPLILLGFVGMESSPATAAGALAIGEPAHVEKRGLAIGTAYNYHTKNEAEQGALKRCKSFPDAPPDVHALCKVLKAFENQCVSVAIDPKAGTPGFGWAVMDKANQSDEAALNNCRKIAGKGRADFCKIISSECDNADASAVTSPQK
jgi:hypothetical protein